MPRARSTSRLSRRQFLRWSAGSSLLIPAASVLAQQSTVDAETSFGRVRGLRVGEVNIFKGIPYGADTGGANRFMPPKDPIPWREYRETFDYGPAAPQSNPDSGRQQDGQESEDCLVLNVWTRGSRDGLKRPVMFWCHGGSFRNLSGSSPRYDGTNLSMRGDVVVVTINHRLNMMGFTHFGDMGEEDFASSGTVGMQDIVHALKWVKNNIEEFGGDPNRVMIFGESGGGRKVATLLAMPEAKGLFHTAVIESGATLRLPERDYATNLAQRLLDTLEIQASDLRSIQNVPLQKLMSAYYTVEAANEAPGPGGTFAPTMDGEVLPFHPFYPDASPVNPDVPVIIGANRTEMTYFSDDAAFELDEAGMASRVRGIVGEDQARDVIGVYREANPTASPSELYFLIFSDAQYVMASITIAERRAALGGGLTYLYYLRWNSGRLMSPHTLDIPFIFDNVREHNLTSGSETAIDLADKVSDSIIAFARTGYPNAGKLPQWKAYDSTNRATMVLNDTSVISNDPIAEQRKIMQSILNL